MNTLAKKQIQTHIETITACITDVLDAKSIILLGSSARDELSFQIIPSGKIELFSDYECMVVVEKRPSSDQRQALQAKLVQLEQEINNPNPLFHIDIIVREEKRLKALQPIIFTYEMKANGKVLYGEDILSQVPPVTLDNLDLKNTNEILYKRLWALLLHLPETFITGQQMNIAEKRVTGYVLCRNALDITTVLLPHQKILLPTYQQRVSKLKECYKTFDFASEFGSTFPDFLQTCLTLRQSLRFEDLDLNAWYSETINYLTLSLNQIGLALDATAASKIYNEWPISRGEWYNLAHLIQKEIRQHGLRKTSQWLRTSNKQKLTIGLLRMHQALIAWQNGDEETAVSHLQHSQQNLDELLLIETKTTQPNFLQHWFDLRQQWAEFWRIYIRLNDPKYIERFTRITKWQYQ